MLYEWKNMSRKKVNLPSSKMPPNEPDKGYVKGIIENVTIEFTGTLHSDKACGACGLLLIVDNDNRCTACGVLVGGLE